MDSFKLVSDYQPRGDQPEAIDALVAGIENGIDEQVLLGVTGSGKTFTMANVIARLNRPTLVLAHNKTLAAQLCSEFKEFFPENAVEYLSPITTITSRRHISRIRTPLSKRTAPSMTRSSGCATARPRAFLSGVTSSWFLPFPVSTAWGIRSTMPTW